MFCNDLAILLPFELQEVVFYVTIVEPIISHSQIHIRPSTDVIWLLLYRSEKIIQLEFDSKIESLTCTYTLYTPEVTRVTNEMIIGI